MLWTQDALWRKARLYMTKALAQDREGAEFPFHASLALEFLTRATVAGIHPALLAELKDPNNLLYAFGLLSPAKNFSPKSIPTKDVITRCALIVASFDDEDEKLCRALAERRNEEVHSAGLPFSDFPTQVWLARFYRTSKKLLEAQKKSLADFLGTEEAVAAEKMIEAADKNLASDVKKLIASHKKSFSEKMPEVQDQLKEDAKEQAFYGRTSGVSIVTCPACGADAIVHGQFVQSQPPLLVNDRIVVKEVYLPTELTCCACRLRLDTHAKLDVAELGGQFNYEWEFDPIWYFGGIDPSQSGETYGND